MAELSDKQKKFADEYIKCLNASDAYRKAGYKCKSDNSIKVCASQLLTNPNVRAYISTKQAKLQEKTDITQEKILKELAAIAFQDITDLVQIVEKTITNKETGEKIKYKVVDVSETDKLYQDDKRIISSIKQGRNGIEVATHDKMKALELLGKHLGMFSEKIEQQETPVININFAKASENIEEND